MELPPLVRPPVVVDICISRWAGTVSNFTRKWMASFGMKAYRSRLARVLDPASKSALPRPPCCCPAQMIPDVAIHDPWPAKRRGKRLKTTWHLQATVEGEKRSTSLIMTYSAGWLAGWMTG